MIDMDHEVSLPNACKGNPAEDEYLFIASFLDQVFVASERNLHWNLLTFGRSQCFAQSNEINFLFAQTTLNIFCFFSNNFEEKTVDFSRIRTRVIEVEGMVADLSTIPMTR